MNGPRHISECIGGWLDDYEEKHVNPFNLPDALVAIRAELDRNTDTEGAA